MYPDGFIYLDIDDLGEEAEVRLNVRIEASNSYQYSTHSQELQIVLYKEQFSLHMTAVLVFIIGMLVIAVVICFFGRYSEEDENEQREQLEKERSSTSWKRS